MVGSSSQADLLIKMDSLTPNNKSNQLLNRSKNEERSFDLSFDKGSAKATLNHVKSFLIKKFKEDIIWALKFVPLMTESGSTKEVILENIISLNSPGEVVPEKVEKTQRFLSGFNT